MLHNKFHDNRDKKMFEGFFAYFIWAWRPSWSCDQDAANKLSFPHPMDALHEILLQSTRWFQKRRCLKMLIDDILQTTDYRRQTTTTEARHTISSPVSRRLG